MSKLDNNSSDSSAKIRGFESPPGRFPALPSLLVQIHLHEPLSRVDIKEDGEIKLIRPERLA